MKNSGWPTSISPGSDRLTNLNDKITRLQVNLQKLDKSKPEYNLWENVKKLYIAVKTQHIFKQRGTKLFSYCLNYLDSHSRLGTYWFRFSQGIFCGLSHF